LVVDCDCSGEYLPASGASAFSFPSLRFPLIFYIQVLIQRHGSFAQ
jgi:hypothetical protein